MHAPANHPLDGSAFYAALPAFARFADVADASRYRPLPDDWWIGVTDVVGSTAAIAAGRYKSVNLAGAWAISAVMNALHGASFPFHVTGWKVGGFDPGNTRRTTASNADFRKFDDGLRLTIDCDAATQSRIEALLRAAAAEGVVDWGLHAQSAALMTCIVPSFMRDDHLHFVDGADGGYTRAAQAIKAGGAGPR